MNSINNFAFGISSWSFPWSVGVSNGPQPDKKMTAIELIEKAAQHNVKLVQIADNLPLEKLNKEELKNLKNAADSNNIKIEVGTKGIQIDHLLKFLEIAEYLESPILRTLPAIFGVRAPIDEIEINLSQVLTEFEKANIKIVLENQEAYKVSEYSKLINKIDNPYLGICLDLANALGAMESPHYVMEELGKYTGNFHFKDVKIIRSKTLMGFTIIGTSSGKGSIPIKWALEELKKLNLFPNVILELWPEWQADIDSTIVYEESMVEESIKFMKTLIW